jgi:hypothetical protein
MQKGLLTWQMQSCPSPSALSSYLTLGKPPTYPLLALALLQVACSGGRPMQAGPNDSKTVTLIPEDWICHCTGCADGDLLVVYIYIFFATPQGSIQLWSSALYGTGQLQNICVRIVSPTCETY